MSRSFFGFKLLFAVAVALGTTSAFVPSGRVVTSPKKHPVAALNTRPSQMQPLRMAEPSPEVGGEKKSLQFLLDPGTKGGAMFLSLVLFVVPIIIYNIATTFGGVDEIQAGIFIGVGFTVVATLAWVSSYLFRVATKDMTYAKQLKDYENAVIAKRLEELDEDEIQALQEEIERDNF